MLLKEKKMSLENIVKELRDKVEGLKQLTEELDPKTKESRFVAIRRLTDEIVNLKTKSKESFLRESQVFLVKTPTDFPAQKEKLNKFGFTANLEDLAFKCSERLVDTVIYRNGAKDGYSLPSIISLLSQEIRSVLVSVGFDGRDVPKILGLKNSSTPRTREELSSSVHKIIKDSCQSEMKDFEEIVFTYATKDITDWLVKQKVFNSSNKVLVVISSSVDNKIIQYLQKKSGKAVNIIESETLQTTLDSLKKVVKLTA